jgi:hypothetical protein
VPRVIGQAVSAFWGGRSGAEVVVFDPVAVALERNQLGVVDEQEKCATPCGSLSQSRGSGAARRAKEERADDG